MVDCKQHMHYSHLQYVRKMPIFAIVLILKIIKIEAIDFLNMILTKNNEKALLFYNMESLRTVYEDLEILKYLPY